MSAEENVRVPGGTRKLFGLPGFKPLIVTYAVNDIGDLLAMVALAVFIYDGTDSAYALAAMFMASKLVPSLIAPWMTAKLAPLRVGLSLPVLYFTEAALFAVLALLVAADAPLGWLLLLAALDGLLAVTGRGLTRGVMATVFDRGGLLRAGNAFVSVLNGWLLVTATAGSYLLIRATSPLTALWIDVGTFLFAAIVLTVRGQKLPPAEHHDEEDETEEGSSTSGWARMREGIAHISQHPRAKRLVIGEGIAMTTGALVIPVEVIYAKESLGAGSEAYGILLASWGVGSIIGATYFQRNHHKNLAMIVAGAAVVCGIGYLGLAAAPTIAIAIIFNIIGGAGNGAEWVGVVTALQEEVDSKFYARASGLLESITTAGPAAAYAGGAALTAASGPRITFLIGGLASVAVGIWWYLKPIAGPHTPTTAPAPETTGPATEVT